MRLTGYFLPNLIFLLLIVLAWINIDWVHKTFTYLEDSESATQNEPVIVMHNGKQTYSSPPQSIESGKASTPTEADNKQGSYSIEFSLLQVYPNNTITATDPFIVGITGITGDSRNILDSIEGEERDNFRIQGDTLSTNGDNKILISGISGDPASFVFDSANSQASGSARNILYDVDKVHWLLVGTKSSPSNIFWTSPDEANLAAAAQSIDVSQPQKISKLAGNVKLEYSQTDENMVIYSDRATINGNSEDLIIEGQVRMEHTNEGELVTASSHRGYYKTDEEFILSGNAKIYNHKDDSSIAAEKILYNLQDGSWRILAQDKQSNTNENSQDSDAIEGKIEIIIPQ